MPATLSVKDRMPTLKRALQQLAANRVLVGIPAEKALRDPDERDGTEKPTNAFLGYVHDNGAPEANIPARPWLRAGVVTVQTAIDGEFKGTALTLLNGGSADVMVTLNRVGLIAVNAVRAKITDGPFAPLAERTLADRKRRGFKGEKPLIESGQLRRAVSYVIRPADRTDSA